MRKLFENPTISSVELTSEDVIMASTIAAQNTGLGSVSDTKAAAEDSMWKGVDDAWL